MLVPSQNCGCAREKEHTVRMHQQRLMQFLNGLNGTYDQARRQILMKTNEPTLNQAYALISQDESQQPMGNLSVTEKLDPLSMQAGRGQHYRGRKQFLQYQHCKMNGHTKENCFKIIGYLDDFKVKRGYQPRGGLMTFNNVEGPLTTRNLQSKGGDYFFTESQYQQMLSFLNKEGPSDTTVQTQANMAGTICLFSSDMHPNDWIVDSRATHYIASTLNLLHNIQSIDKHKRESVSLPNGTSTDILILVVHSYQQTAF